MKEEDQVWLYQKVGPRLGVAYGLHEHSCRPISEDRVLDTDGSEGWIRESWVWIIAG
ncbi:MAG: hypothetical protein AAGE61_05765 [Pseudomonadota bacterium]